MEEFLSLSGNPMQLRMRIFLGIKVLTAFVYWEVLLQSKLRLDYHHFNP